MAARPKSETTFDVLNRQAAAGDIAGMMETLLQDGGLVNGQRKGEYIQATAAAAAKNCPQMIDDVLAMSIANTAELLMRATYMAKVKMASEDKHATGPFTANIPTEVAEVDLPRITRLEDRLVALAKARATILHTCRLADTSTDSRIVKLHDGPRAVASGE